MMQLYKNEDINFIDEEVSFFSTLPLLDNSKFLGYTKDCTVLDNGPLGYEADDSEFYIPVFIVNFSNRPLSDEESDEQKAIDNGKNCAIFVHGKGEESYIMRYTSKELKLIDFSFFTNADINNAFLYRS